MESVTVEKRGLRSLYRLCPKRHVLLLISVALILLHLAARGNKALMVSLSGRFVQPLHHALAKLNSHVPFSVAELIWALGVIAAAVYIISQIVLLFLRKDRLKRVYIIFITVLSIAAFIYAMFCMLWGTYYYGDDFQSRSGIESRDISAEELAAVTEYFALRANEYADKVMRNEDGFYVCDRDSILARSDEVFDAVVEDYPSLDGPRVRAKGIFFSRVMSYTNFTGFFFPFTAEANVNTDFPPALFASTVAHELSHQRGVAKEQEANFTAVLASLYYGDADYCYSSCLLAYVHLGNALYRADHAEWERVYALLDERVVKDFALDTYYWRQFDTPVQAVSNTVYEGFLQSYDQKLGMRSYGACVDLLVNHYYEEAKNFME